LAVAAELLVELVLGLGVLACPGPLLADDPELSGHKHALLFKKLHR
jgi:hypothetical protein